MRWRHSNCMCESGCDTDEGPRGFAAQNADHASLDHWLLRYRGNKQEMGNAKLGSFQTSARPFCLRFRSTSGRSPHYIERRVVPVEVKFNEFNVFRTPYWKTTPQCRG
jgi:hypothetical protein